MIQKRTTRVKSDSASDALSIASLFLLCLPLLLASPSFVYGYTDPGSGAFIYQAVYAAVLGGTYYFRKFLTRILGKRNRK